MSHVRMTAVIIALFSVAVALGFVLYAHKPGAVSRESRSVAPPGAKSQARDPKPLLDAIESSDVAKVDALLAEGYDARTAADDRGTVLIVAAAHGYKDIAALLIDAGSGVNAPKYVTYVVDNRPVGDLPAVEMTLTHSDMLGGYTQMTPLETAALYGELEVAKLLIDRGATVAAKTWGGMTALHYAAWSGHKDVAALLIARGADVRAAATEEPGDVPGGLEPIHCAVNSSDTVALLLDSGAAVDAKDDRGNTPLMRAAGQGNVDVVSLLLARGASARAPIGDHRSPLLAALHGRGCSRPETPRDPHDPRHVKAMTLFTRYEDVALLLIADGADVEAQDTLGETPLHLAVQADSTKVVSLLVAKGANVNAMDKHSCTPFDTAVKRKRPEIAEFLRQHGAVAGSQVPDAGIADAARTASESSGEWQQPAPNGRRASPMIPEMTCPVCR